MEPVEFPEKLTVKPSDKSQWATTGMDTPGMGMASMGRTKMRLLRNFPPPPTSSCKLNFGV